MITSLSQMADSVRTAGRKYRIAVAWGQDQNTIGSLHRAVKEGFVEAVLIGSASEIGKVCRETGCDPSIFTVIESEDEKSAAETAVSMTAEGEADIVMKGLVGTDKFLRAVMDKEKGLLAPGSVMTYVCAIEIPAYRKLLFVTDTAVIPFPDLKQKVAMAEYALSMARRFGIVMPKVALIGASEKVSDHFPNTLDYAEMCRMAGDGRISPCIMDGPLDLFLACDPESVKIKGVTTPVDGDADILLFPTLEACNPFYKSLMLFGKGELAGMIRGTTKPVVLMSRSESELSKYYCVALACLMASVPALGQQLGMDEAALQTFLGENLPAMAGAMAGMPDAMGRFTNVVEIFRAHLDDYDTIKTVAFVPIVWTLIVGGILAALGGVWALFAPRRKAQHAEVLRPPQHVRTAA